MATEHLQRSGIEVVDRFAERENTFCPNCDATLIRRQGFYVTENRMRGNKCPECRAEITGVWERDAPVSSTGTGFARALRM